MLNFDLQRNQFESASPQTFYTAESHLQEEMGQATRERSRRMHALFTIINMLLCLVIAWVFAFSVNDGPWRSPVEEAPLFESSNVNLTIEAPVEAEVLDGPALDDQALDNQPLVEETATDSNSSVSDTEDVLSQ